ncbi:33233_t:CDS:2, partial [Gigaspora margarita]
KNLQKSFERDYQQRKLRFNAITDNSAPTNLEEEGEFSQLKENVTIKVLVSTSAKMDNRKGPGQILKRGWNINTEQKLCQQSQKRQLDSVATLKMETLFKCLGGYKVNSCQERQLALGAERHWNYEYKRRWIDSIPCNRTPKGNSHRTFLVD